MRKLLTLCIGFVVALAGIGETPTAWAATVHACACDTGAAGGCAPGSNTSPYDTPAKAINTISQWKTSCQALAPDDQLLTCEGGAFNGVATANMTCAGNADHPVVIGSYDDSARWSGGAGIRPKFNSSASGGVLSFAKGTGVHTEGLWIKDIEIVGDGTPSWGIVIGADTDYTRITNVKISGVGVGIQHGGATNPPASGDGLTQHCIIEDSTITQTDIGILAGCVDGLVIEGNTFDQNGNNSNQDHHIYLGGTSHAAAGVAIASLTGNGTTATLGTSVPHGIPAGTHFTITTTATCSGGCTGSFAVSGGYGGVVGTVTGASTITYPATGTAAATTLGTYTPYISVQSVNAVVRGNTLTNMNKTANPCNAAAIVGHGDWKNVILDNNFLSNPLYGATVSCAGIEFDSGLYSAPENYEGFTGIVARGNTCLDFQTCVGFDLCVNCEIVNNYDYSTFTGDGVAFKNRFRNFAPSVSGSSTIGATQQQPSRNVIRYNGTFRTAPNGNSIGMALNGNAFDALSGVHHGMYGNLVVFGSSATTSTQCFNTQNITLSALDNKDKNTCLYLGASVPKWDFTSSLATVQAGADANKSDLNSTLSPTASVTTGQPFFTSPTTSPAVGSSSSLLGGGYSASNLKPHGAWGGVKRIKSTTDRGPFEKDATDVLPNSPTNVQVH